MTKREIHAKENLIKYVREHYHQKVWEPKKEEYRWYADPEEVKKAEMELSSEIGGDHYVSRLRNRGLRRLFWTFIAILVNMSNQLEKLLILMSDTDNPV